MTDFQRGLWTATARSRFPAPIRSEAGTMPADHGLRPDDLQSLQNARGQPIQPGKYQTVDAGEGYSPRRFTSQHVELMTKRQDLCLQRRSRSEQSDQRQPNQAANISHQSRASPDSTALTSRIEFPTRTVFFAFMGKDAADHRLRDTSRTPGRRTGNAGRNRKDQRRSILRSRSTRRSRGRWKRSRRYNNRGRSSHRSHNPARYRPL